jgi:hypothetical protein
MWIESSLRGAGLTQVFASASWDTGVADAEPVRTTSADIATATSTATSAAMLLGRACMGLLSLPPSGVVGSTGAGL